MTESSTSASTLKIRIRIDSGTQSTEDAIPAATTFDRRGMAVMLGAVVLLFIVVFGIRGLMKSNLPKPAVEDAPLPLAEINALPGIPSAGSAAVPIPETEPASNAPLPDQTNRVVHAVLTDAPRKRKPLQALSGNIPASDVTRRFYFFTEVNAVSSKRFIHRWEYRGKTVAQIPFSPGGKNWSGSSSKQIPTHMQGDWRVVLVDERNTELSGIAFTYGKGLATAQN